MLRYIKLAIKKPYLIKDVIYKKHLGVIFSCKIQDYIDFYGEEMFKKSEENEFILSRNVEQIFDFYRKMGRDSVTKEKISKWLKDGHHCWLAKYDGVVVGGLWIFFGQVKMNTFTARVLSKNKTIMFNNNVGYRGYVIIDKKYRGKGIYTLFNDWIMKFYFKNSCIDYIILITGASNGAVIRTIMKSYGKLIGIVEIKNIWF